MVVGQPATFFFWIRMSKCELYFGDCLEEMNKIADNSVDLILCDLPYGTTACSWDSVIPFEPLWEHYRRISKEKAAIVLTTSQPFTTTLIQSNIKNFRYEWVWQKHQGTNPMLCHYQPLKIHENICVFCFNGSPNYYPVMTTGKMYGSYESSGSIGEVYGDTKFNGHNKNEGTRYPTTILKYRGMKYDGGLHPTQKPIDLMEYLVRTYSIEGDTVLDNCMGSGSTGVACINTNRNFIGIEKEEKYFSIAKNRIEEENKKKEKIVNFFE